MKDFIYVQILELSVFIDFIPNVIQASAPSHFPIFLKFINFIPPYLCHTGVSREKPQGWGFFPLIFFSQAKKSPTSLGLFRSWLPNIFLMNNRYFKHTILRKQKSAAQSEDIMCVRTYARARTIVRARARTIVHIVCIKYAQSCVSCVWNTHDHAYRTYLILIVLARAYLRTHDPARMCAHVCESNTHDRAYLIRTTKT